MILPLLLFAFILSTPMGVFSEGDPSDDPAPSSLSDTAQPNPPESSPVLSTTPVPTPAPTEAPTPSTSPDPTLVPELSNPDVFGCSWPPDFNKRVDFCVKQSGIDLGEDVKQREIVLYGLLNREVVDTLKDNCLKDSRCPGNYDLKLLQNFLMFWYKNKDKLNNFRGCLQKNTEGMVKLCGPDTVVGKTMSGAAGLHLNLLNVMVRLSDQLHENDTQSRCLLKIAESMHMTAAVYLYTEDGKAAAYSTNTVLCWNVVRDKCDPMCQKFSSEINCMLNTCANVTYDFFRQFGIWEWYFVGPDAVKKNCHVDDSVCTTGDQPHIFSENDSFADKIRRKYHQISVEVERTLHMPLHVVLIIFLSSFSVFVVLVTICCMWYHGMICSDEKRKMRYSQLLDPADARNSPEMKSLAAAMDDDDFE